MRIAILMGVRAPWARFTAEMLARLGHEIHVIDFEESKGSYLSGIGESQVLSDFKKRVFALHFLQGLPASNLRYFLAVPRFRKALKLIHPDILLTLYGGGYAQLALLSGFRPYTVFAVGSDILLQKGIRKFIARFALERAAQVFSNGVFLAEETRLLAPNAKVKALLLGVDTKRFVPGAKSPALQFLCNRGFRFPYNNDSIIQALANLGEVPPFSFHFASAGPELEASKALAASILPRPIRESVKFWGGVTDDQMLGLYQTSQFFVSMSRSDGTATSMLEAMGCGVFPILSDIPQNREWIHADRGNGFLVPLDDSAALTAALRRAMTEPGLQNRVAQFNRELIVKLADSASNLETLASSLGKLAKLQIGP